MPCPAHSVTLRTTQPRGPLASCPTNDTGITLHGTPPTGSGPTQRAKEDRARACARSCHHAVDQSHACVLYNHTSGYEDAAYTSSLCASMVQVLWRSNRSISFNEQDPWCQARQTSMLTSCLSLVYHFPLSCLPTPGCLTGSFLRSYLFIVVIHQVYRNGTIFVCVCTSDCRVGK